MPPLLDKLRRIRGHRPRRPPAQRPHRRLRHDWVFWSCVGGAVIAVFAVFFWMTSARILKRPIRLDFGPEDPAFATALGPIVGAEFTSGNSVQTLVNGAQFFPAMLAAIRGAQHTITLETYIWTPGRISDEFIAALDDRARHGVKVDVLVDGMGTLKFHGADRERLEHAGVRILTYGREHWYEVKPNINHRTHRKLLVVDGRIGFTGGMCIDDRWAGNADSDQVWRDTVVRVEGPVVREMQAVFASNWLRTTSGLLLGEGFFPPPHAVGPSLAQCFMSGPTEAAQYARLGYFFAIASARHTIDISNAYFIPDDLAIDMLVAARRRGVRVRIIVPAFSDSAFGRAASRSRWGRLLAAGVEFYQYTGAMFHCKTMVVDGALLTVGSTNFDNRSFSINDEVELNILDPAVAGRNEQIFQQDLARCRRLDPAAFAQRPWYVKAEDDFCGLFRSQF
ncbi:MAG TPA: phospholipase D-like domain-containing protein [Opitutaceae bacterium]|nr:phospholipase D-like domain-containing protein [Opitutaceae bacterium]